MKLSDFTIATAHDALVNKKVSSQELTKASLAAIEKTNPVLNAFVRTVPDVALAAAADVDTRIAKGESIHALSGIPMGLKDLFCAHGIEATAGSKILKGFVPSYDGTAVKKLRDAGAVIIGMTNMDEFACGASTEHSCYGVTKNPWDLSKVAGGSSGGSAAAVAAQQVLYTLGTDTGGSTRQPAALCGVVSIRVTYGLVSRFGVIAMASSWDTINPITKDVRDLALVLQAIAGQDVRDATTVRKPVPDYAKSLKVDVKGLTLGVPEEYFAEGVEEEVKTAVHASIAHLEKMGAKIKPVHLPMTKYAVACYYVSIPSELSANLARFDGIRYGAGPKKTPKDLQEYYYAARSEGFGDEIKRRIMIGTYALSAGYYDAYFIKAQKVRTRIIEDFNNVFKEVDALIAPTSPYPAFGIGEKVNDPLAMYLADALTIPPCAAGIPALTVPCGFSKSGLPIGMQFLGPQLSEPLLFQLAYSYEQTTEWHERFAKI